MAETTGTGQTATARHTSSLLHGSNDGPSPPPRARITTSTPGRATTSCSASTMATAAPGPDTLVSSNRSGYPGNRTAATDSMSLRTAASDPQTTPTTAG